MNDPDDSLPLDEEANPFDQFDIPEVCAFIHRKLGPDALRELLAPPIKLQMGKRIVSKAEKIGLMSAPS